MATPTSSPSPIEQLASDIASLQREVNSLQDDVRLSHVRDGIEDLETTTNGLPQRIQNLRDRGYVFEKGLEARAAELKNRWATQRFQITQQISHQANLLDMDMRAIDTMMMQLTARSNNPAGAQPFLAQTKSAVNSLESKITAAESTLRGMYNVFSDELNKLKSHFDDIEWMLSQLEQACFKLSPTEAGIMAVQAVWTRDGKEDKDDPKGNLYLTDQRLIFEQKEEIATKKVLFITTEKQKVQRVLLEVLVAQIETVKASKKGLFGNEDFIDLTFASGAQYPSAQLHLKGQDSNEWQGLINRAIAKEFDKGRAVAVDSEAVEKVKAAPTICPGCGGTIAQTILRGMDTITCEYCGYIIRL